MKQCPSCEIDKEASEFGSNKAKPDGLQTHCKMCRKSYNAAHYVKTKDRWKDSRAQSRVTLKLACQQWVGTYLQKHPCVDCGITDIRVLDFDHRGEEPKIADVSTLIQRGSLKSLQEEVSKCDVRCRNCHTIKTYERMASCWRLTLYNTAP